MFSLNESVEPSWITSAAQIPVAILLLRLPLNLSVASQECLSRGKQRLHLTGYGRLVR